MNIIARPPQEPTNGQGSSEPYEDLLRAFFRAEMPEPWPQMQAPEPRVLPFVRPTRVGRFASVKSRMALAASVVILLVGSWFLSGALRDSKPVDGGQPSDVATEKNTNHKLPPRP